MRIEMLSEVADIIMGQSPPSSSYNVAGKGLPFFQGKSDFGEVYPKARVFCSEPKKIAEAGDILISVRAPVGPTNINPHKSCIGRGLAALRCSQALDSVYLLYFLRFHEPQLAQIGKGSTFEAINRDDLENLHLPLPPLPEQRRIAAILAKADRLRRLRRYALGMGESYLQTVFMEMFGDPATNPKGWDVAKLGEICTLIRDGVHQTPTYIPSGVPFITVKNIVTGKVDFSDTKFISQEEHEQISRIVKPERGDILVSKDGTIGVPCVIDTDREFSIFVSVALLKLDSRMIDSDFLANQIRSKALQDQIFDGIKGIAIRHLHLGDFKQLKIILPPLDLQQHFAYIVRQQERLRAQQREALRQAEHLFHTLLHQAFQGQLGADSPPVADVLPLSRDMRADAAESHPLMTQAPFPFNDEPLGV